MAIVTRALNRANKPQLAYLWAQYIAFYQAPALSYDVVNTAFEPLWDTECKTEHCYLAFNGTNAGVLGALYLPPTSLEIGGCLLSSRSIRDGSVSSPLYRASIEHLGKPKHTIHGLGCATLTGQ